MPNPLAPATFRGWSSTKTAFAGSMPRGSSAAAYARGSGFWVEPHPSLGLAAVIWSYVYAGAMAVRYVIRMIRRPDQRWLGGTIPIVFHTLVAAFQWTFGWYQIADRIGARS